MGILSRPLAFILKLPLPAAFSVCELGDQYITEGDYMKGEARRLSRDFYQNEMRCGRYESIDGNGRGTFTADLNVPLPKNFGQFDLVTDFGTGEHVFNQWQVFKTIHYLTKMGGFIVWDRPTQGYSEHCYFNANECLYRDLAAANDYRLHRLEFKDMPRGKLIRGVFQRTTKGKFVVPQQGRYHKILRPIMQPGTDTKQETTQ